MEEVKRFLDSINFECDDEILNKISIEKVEFNKKLKIYTVYLKCINILNYDLVNDLLNHAQKGINGVDSCLIKFIYDNVTIEDTKEYFNKILNSIIFEHPSLMSLENCFKEIEDHTIYLEVSSDNEVAALKEIEHDIIDNLKKYGLGDYLIEVSVNQKLNEELKKEMAFVKEAKIEKKEESPVIFGFHKDGDATLILLVNKKVSSLKVIFLV